MKKKKCKEVSLVLKIAAGLSPDDRAGTRMMNSVYGQAGGGGGGAAEFGGGTSEIQNQEFLGEKTFYSVIDGLK